MTHTYILYFYILLILTTGYRFYNNFEFISQVLTALFVDFLDFSLNISKIFQEPCSERL